LSIPEEELGKYPKKQLIYFTEISSLLAVSKPDPGL